MKINSISYNYDKLHDVLYLSIGEPRASYGEDIEEGIIMRYDMTTDELTGVTILDFAERVRENDPGLSKIPIEFDFNLACASL